MRVAVCIPQVPFVRGGAEILVDALVDALRRRGHQADIVSMPFKWYPDADLLQGALAWRTVDLTEANGQPVDVVIATKFPSYLVRHPRKVVWLFHQFRQAYELHGTPLAQFADDARGTAMRDAIREMDALAFGEARGVFTISRNVAARLARFNGVTAEALRPPPQDLDLSWRGDDGDILSVGRLDAAKRNDLLLRAVALAPAARATIVGDGPARPDLEALARTLGIEDRIRFTGRLSDGDLAERYGRCRAVFYAPFDEDYGFVPIEAHRAHKPVVTTGDAGGPLEFVQDGETGLVAAPTPEAVAAALARLSEDAALARAMGDRGAERSTTHDWDAIVEALLGAAA